MSVQNRVNNETLEDSRNKIKIVTFTNTDTTYQMTVNDHLVHVVSGTGEDTTGIITLPSIGEAAGMFYAIYAPTGATGNDVSVAEKENATEISTYGDLDADADFLLVFSDGQYWRVVTSVLS